MRDLFMEKQHALIIGAGPAGLTAAYELLTKTNIKMPLPIHYNISKGLAKHIIVTCITLSRLTNLKLLSFDI